MATFSGAGNDFSEKASPSRVAPAWQTWRHTSFTRISEEVRWHKQAALDGRLFFRSVNLARPRGSGQALRTSGKAAGRPLPKWNPGLEYPLGEGDNLQVENYRPLFFCINRAHPPLGYATQPYLCYWTRYLFYCYGSRKPNWRNPVYVDWWGVWGLSWIFTFSRWW